MRVQHLISATLFICMFSASAHAQTVKINYEREWRKIDSLYFKAGLTRSAITRTDQLYAAAKKEKNEPQMIKALLFKLGLQENIVDDGIPEGIRALEKELAAASSETSKAILRSILAFHYMRYYDHNRWRFYNRTQTVNFKKEDIATWTSEDLHRKISELYMASLHQETLLQQTRLEKFEPLIEKGNVRYLRPTLFDLLAHEALRYLKNSERYLNEPTYEFELNDRAAFADAAAFSKHRFASRDSAANMLKALHIYQKLLRFHLNDAKPSALIDADVDRLQFVKQYAEMDGKDSLYKAALESLAAKYPGDRETDQVWFLIAQWHSEKAAAYSPFGDTTHRYDYVTARKIAERIVAQKDSSYGRENSKLLLNRILRQQLGMTTEKVNLPGQPFRMRVSYKNFTQLHFRLIKADNNLRMLAMREQHRDDFWEKVMKLPAIKTFSQTLPATNDHQEHAVEIKIDALPFGDYALIASPNKDFALGSNPMAMQYFYVSNIAYLNNGSDYFVLHRETGKPLEGAAVKIWRTAYDYRKGSWTLAEYQNLKADKNGFFRIRKDTATKNREGALQVEVTTADDHLFLADQAELYRYYDGEAVKVYDQKEFEEQRQRVYQFTDRSIYRPAQTVYFKGLLTTIDFKTRKAKIVPGIKTRVYLYNNQGDKADSLDVTTNDFGSYSGTFKLPASVLTGEFRMEVRDAEGQVQFSVEEYKRPKFLVDFEKPKDMYRINDSVHVTGFAKAYAGNNIDGAKVKYRVVRIARFPYPWLLWKWGWPRIQQKEIAHGEITTGADGRFSIAFVAVPDKTVRKDFEPIFEYQVTADVTDINGETRVGNTTISVSYKALQLSVDVPQGTTLRADSLTKLTIRSVNLAGEHQPAKVNVAMYRLNAPQRLIRNRYWEQPDQFVMSRAEYLQHFPYDEYANETKKESWERLEKVYERTDSTRISGEFLLARVSPAESLLKAGWYAIEVTTTDKYGEPVKDIEYVQLLDPATGLPGSPQYNWELGMTPRAYQPGQTAVVDAGTSANDVFVIQELDKSTASRIYRQEDKVSQYNFSVLSNQKKSTAFPISEEDRGGFGVFHAFVKHNRFYITSTYVAVPWSNKELNISYETFRDKTLPGSQEKWKVKLTGDKNDRVSAEILTAMYDASLDQFRPHEWQKPDVWPVYAGNNDWTGTVNFTFMQATARYVPQAGQNFERNYDFLVTGITDLSPPRHMKMPKAVSSPEERLMGNYSVSAESQKRQVGNGYGEGDASMQAGEIFIDGEAVKKPNEPTQNEATQIRKNFNETAFFFPDLKTDSAGNVEFSFTIPEALTQWKWMLLSHSKDLALGYSEKSIVTQKELMVQPNIPRFVREGDRMDLSAKIVNMGTKEVSGQIQLLLIDATTNQSVDGWFQNMFPNQYFTAAAGQSTVINFTVQIPFQFNKPVIIRYVARAGNVSDGEEIGIPVLSNRLLVTESLPLNVRGGGTRTFTFDKLVKSGDSETLSHHAVTVEFTSNPAWYAVQAIPYLMEYPYECAEQLWNRVYANALAAKIVNASPRIKEIFSKWKSTDTAALLSNLQKNEELKSVLLEETPWVLQAKNETEQKKRIAMLFDMVKLSEEIEKNLDKLLQMQSSNGGFVWFKGGPDDRYITQYIVTGIGHLKKLNAIPASHLQKINAIVAKAIPYLDRKIKEDYDNFVKNKADLTKQQVNYIQIQYLYMRSYFKDINAAGNVSTPFNYFRKQSQQFWLQQNKYMQGMIALSLFRTGDGKTATDILRSLKQNAIIHDELGMYWKDMSGGYYWHQAPVETQALLIEAFSEITKDLIAVDGLRTWLLKNKQTNNWRTTKATADACYAMLLQGTDWLSAEPIVQIKLGDKNVSSRDQKTEAGSGYFKKVFDAPFVNNTMGEITVNVQQPNDATGKPMTGTAWGAVYWQYFDNLENITPAATPLKLSKKLFIERNTDRGPVLDPVEENGTLKVGDKIKVRIELRVDRNMEYVHMKDMRASSLEPVNVLSSWKWQGGLGYYESTRDASTNFFFNYLPRGTYVFEYALFVTHTGTFSNGITTIQCMYAPEFASHSEGVKINVEGN